METYTDPDGRKWRRATGYNGYLMGADGRMHYDVHTGRGSRTVWQPVIPAKQCDHCDQNEPRDIHAKAKHYREAHDIDIFERKDA